jgi:glycosyltransferase involved in cell wall biosynthesis
MATGRAIVTTNLPGCRETVVDNRSGLLVPARDPVALAKAMERFLVEPRLISEFGERARQLAVGKFDVHAVNAMLLRYIEIPQADELLP